MKPLRAETTEEIAAIAREKGCRLLAIEPTGVGRTAVLRLVLERADGSPVSVEDCEAVSRDVSTLLDAADEISHSYALEASPAGLERKLYTLRSTAVRRSRVRVKTDSRSTESEPGGDRAAGATVAAAEKVGRCSGS